MAAPSGDEPVILKVEPTAGVEGGIISVLGLHLTTSAGGFPSITLGDQEARPSIGSSTRLSLPIPPTATSGPLSITCDDRRLSHPFTIGTKLAGELHAVANPVVTPDGTVITTISGRRGQKFPISIVRVAPDGTVAPLATVMNPTGLVLDTEGFLLVSSRFEGRVYRIHPHGEIEAVADGMGIATGLTLGPDGALYVGDRTGTVYRVERGKPPEPFASLPPSVAAFHLSLGPDGSLYATAPTLSNADPIYRINHHGDAEPYAGPFERPQGLTFDPQGRLWLVAGMGGQRGAYLLKDPAAPTFAVTGANLVGLAFTAAGDLFLASTTALFRLPASGLP